MIVLKTIVFDAIIFYLYLIVPASMSTTHGKNSPDPHLINNSNIVSVNTNGRGSMPKLGRILAICELVPSLFFFSFRTVVL